MSTVPVLTPRTHSVEEPIVPQKDLQEKDNCSICLLEMIDRTETACHHFFHEGCLNLWLALKKTCPLCRDVLVKEQPHRPVPAADQVYDLDIAVRYGRDYASYGHIITNSSCMQTLCTGCCATEYCGGVTVAGC